jgi:hypothetical protein
MHSDFQASGASHRAGARWNRQPSVFDIHSPAMFRLPAIPIRPTIFRFATCSWIKPSVEATLATSNEIPGTANGIKRRMNIVYNHL